LDDFSYNNNMDIKITQTINNCINFFGITIPAVEGCAFQDWRGISTRARGIYVIYGEDQVIYVGKGQIRSRQDKHWQKALANFRSAKDTLGWRWLRENRAPEPDQWQMVYISGLTRTAQSALEGSLIHFLQPLANDETVLDLLGE